MKVETNDQLSATIALAGLEMVMDPEIGLNVVDLGLVYRLWFNRDENELHCIMTLTTQFCPMGQSITQAARQCLEETFPGMGINLQLSFEPPWNYERISETGRQFLNSR